MMKRLIIMAVLGFAHGIALLKKENPDDEGKAFDFGACLSRSFRAQVNEYQGKTKVDVRAFWMNKSGELNPSKKGIQFDASTWEAFLENKDSIDNAASNGTEMKKEIGENIFVQVKEGSVDIRSFYIDKKDNELKPSLKGVHLTNGEWKALKGAVPDLNTALANTGKGGYEGKPFEFGDCLKRNFRAQVNEYQGKTAVDVRAFWMDKTGELNPSKKGIRFTASEWATFLENKDSINKAALGGTEMKKEIGEKLFVQVQGGSVDFRKYYESKSKSDPGLKPSLKGVHLTNEEWKAFQDAVPDLSKALKDSQSK